MIMYIPYNTDECLLNIFDIYIDYCYYTENLFASIFCNYGLKITLYVAHILLNMDRIAI